MHKSNRHLNAKINLHQKDHQGQVERYLPRNGGGGSTLGCRLFVPATGPAAAIVVDIKLPRIRCGDHRKQCWR